MALEMRGVTISLRSRTTSCQLDLIGGCPFSGNDATDQKSSCSRQSGIAKKRRAAKAAGQLVLRLAKGWPRLGFARSDPALPRGTAMRVSGTRRLIKWWLSLIEGMQ
jgi:hypothetical protein